LALIGNNYPIVVMINQWHYHYDYDNHYQSEFRPGERDSALRRWWLF